MPAPAPKKKKTAVRIRCYRQGLGDCFLLTFTTGKTKKSHVLIDCGVWPKGPVHTAKMREIVTDIIKETGGSFDAAGQPKTRGTIDVLVGTHEHWDHLSGFHQARDLFTKGLTVRHVWLAWTEGDDDLAKELRKEKKKKEKAVREIHARLAGMPRPQLSLAGQAALQQLDSVLGFLGVDGAKAGTIDEAMDFVTSGFPGAKTECLFPGAVPDVPGAAGVRAFVLGPPHDRAKIRKSTPSKAHREVYELFFGLSLEDSLLAALGAHDDAQARFRDPDEIGRPFDRTHRLKIDEVRKAAGTELGAFLRDHYDAEDWRRIDHDWLFAGGSLALRLDSATNNTSLVLAFELPDKRVLLFPGDAQVGNWLSWHDPHDWKDAQGRAVSVTARDLLERTVFYKVGHHGSHNATLRELGLELMGDPGLIAVVPVSHQMALANKWDKIPLQSLVDRLREQTRGRLWFTVEYQKGKKNFTNPDIATLTQLKPAERTALKKSVAVDPLWLDFTL